MRRGQDVSHPNLIVFISHARADTWVARQISTHITNLGLRTFLDVHDIKGGDAFDDEILAAVEDCAELVVLLTHSSKGRPYVWLEVGAFLGLRKRVTLILSGMLRTDYEIDNSIPLAMKRLSVKELNDIGEYFAELLQRTGETTDA